ncbi:MAG: 50S ribosomal protein L13 [Candidatus Dormibacteraeota bacterium]|nr:50S ribosomal protein L13 [Candidatus Dormibacteraeota bacterium]
MSSATVQRSFVASEATADEQWWLVDARNQTLGRLAVNIARLLRGKHLATYTPHALMGDHVVVINAGEIVVTGSKRTTKIYDHYTGYPGGRRERTYDEVVKRDPTTPLHEAVRGMLQHNTLGGRQLKRLKIYAGSDHPHVAQQPKAIRFGDCGEVVSL